ncbi:MAG: amino acid adenylation domain-containing protein, partial [Chitinophagaceae bacterium]
MSKKIFAEHGNSMKLSAGQKELWYWQKKEPLSGAYNEGLVFALDNIDFGQLRAAFHHLSKRHPVLRTAHIFLEGEPRAVINDEDIDFVVQKVSSCTNEELYAIINAEYNKPFDLSRSVIRIRIYERDSGRAVMLAVVHHIACDGWSLKILWNELLHCYVQPEAQAEAMIPSYNDFVQNESDYLQTAEADNTLAFWKQQLETINVHPYPLLEAEQPAHTPAAAHFVSALEPEVFEQLRNIAHAAGCTLFEALLAIYHLSICYFTREPETLIGSPFFNRLSEFKQVAGYFVNAIGLKNEWKANTSFAQQIAALHEYMKQVRMHARYPFVAVKENMQHAALHRFQYFFSVRNRLFDISSPEGALKDKLSFSYEVLDILSKTDPQFDLHLEVYEAKQGSKAVFHYNTAVIDESMVMRLADRFQQLCARVAADPQVRLGELIKLPEAEAKNVIALGHGSERSYDIHSGFSTLFCRQANESRENIAVKDSNKTWTYQELMQQAAKASCCLLRSAPKNVTNPVIAVCLPRSCELVATAIGIWQMGGIYMPVDPGLPMERISYMLKDAGASLFISDQPLQGISIKQLSIGELFDGDETEGDLFAEPLADADCNGAYLLYTSGSTGKPKGVLVGAAGMLNHIHSKCEDLQLSAQSIVAQTASVSFDVSIWQTFACLLAGGCVRIYSRDEVLNIKHHLTQLQNDAITVMQMVPSYLREFITEAEHHKNIILPSLQYLVSAGEELDGGLSTRWFQRFAGCAIANCYGPTEASDNISINIFRKSGHALKIPAGKAINNMQLYVVDAAGNLCQKGVTGEIWVSGIGCARGYIGNAVEKTAEVFTEDPFTEGRWLYKTGDLGRWGMKDELLHFCGRKDRQVKLRGQRVELSEIENIIQQHKAVKQCAVIYNDEEGGSLAGYIVWKQGAAMETLGSYLREQLPAYMIPAHLVELEEMPLTASGKLDRKQLPAVANNHQHITPATNALEESLLKMW